MSQRFFAPQLACDAEVTLGGAEARHLKTVCRAQLGTEVTLFDGAGRRCRAVVADVGRREVVLRTGAVAESQDRTRPLTLAVAMPKGDRASFLVEKLTELGVRELVPLLTERSVAEPGGGKLDKLRRTVVEACKQCGRDRLMTIRAPAPWTDFLTAAARPRTLLHTGGAATDTGTGVSPRTVAVGPEGGWTDAEAAAARAAGWTVTTLPGHVLRIETAAMAAVWL